MKNKFECPVCESSKINLFMKGVFDSDATNVMECENCGLQFLDPIMSIEEEEDYYDGYYNKQKKRNFKPMNLADVQLQTYMHYEQYQNIYLKLLNNSKSILEIGSGNGGFLKFIIDNFPDKRIIALERCDNNTKFIRECFKQKVQTIKNLKEIANETFDCICAFGVFEHIRDSKSFLTQLAKHLQKNGNLALTVPNKHHALVYQYEVEEFKKFTYMKQHYFTFTEESHRLLAAKTGLKIKGFNYMQVWGLDNQLSWLKHRRPRNYSDITSFLSSKTINSYNKDMIRNKTTDLVMATYTRK